MLRAAGTHEAGMTRRARPDLDAMSIEEGGEIMCLVDAPRAVVCAPVIAKLC